MRVKILYFTLFHQIKSVEKKPIKPRDILDFKIVDGLGELLSQPISMQDSSDEASVGEIIFKLFLGKGMSFANGGVYPSFCLQSTKKYSNI